MLPKVKHPVWTPEIAEVSITPEDCVDIPLLGWISAGQPMDLCEDDSFVSVPINMVRKNSYALKVRGHSMVDDNIQDGDVIIIQKRQTAENGQSVIAMINNEQVTLKKFYIEPNGIRLQPANPDMEPIILTHEEIQILGVVSGIIRHVEH